MIKNANEVTAGIHKWETKMTTLMDRFKKKDLDDDLKIAILLGMVPKDYQEIILQTAMTTEDLKYTTCRDRIIQMARQRIQMVQPVPMDLDKVREEEEEGGEEEHVDAVGQGVKCYNCQGYGHLSRDCATPKGKGKSSNGKGDYGKGDYGKGGYGKGDYGKGTYGKGQHKGFDTKGYGKGDFKGSTGKG